jgi:MFS family permease
MMIRLNRSQWLVLFAAWLGWGFDVFDGLLLNFVAPNAIPTLLDIPLGTPAAKTATIYWTGILTSILLVGWAVGGILFGKVADRIGRTKTLLITMLLYAFGTAACAFAPNIWFLVACRVVASIGIGGEWAAGAAMVAEAVPEKYRVEAGALLYTAAPMGLFLATIVEYMFVGVWFADSPETSWRYVFLCGLIPAALAFVVRLFVEEPERWQQASENTPAPRIRELWTPAMRPLTISGFAMAFIAMLAWWSCNAFIPVVAGGLAQASAALRGLDTAATHTLAHQWKLFATCSFNLGGLIGTLLTVPIARHLGRRPMFGLYFALSAVAIMTGFGLDLSPEARLLAYFFIGLTVFGIFGSFTFYLPELFPTRLRATGSGFCYNAGRLLAAGGPFAVGYIATQGPDALTLALNTLFWVGLVPAAGVLLMPWVIETRGRALAD